MKKFTNVFKLNTKPIVDTCVNPVSTKTTSEPRKKFEKLSFDFQNVFAPQKVKHQQKVEEEVHNSSKPEKTCSKPTNKECHNPFSPKEQTIKKPCLHNQGFQEKCKTFFESFTKKPPTNEEVKKTKQTPDKWTYYPKATIYEPIDETAFIFKVFAGYPPHLATEVKFDCIKTVFYKSEHNVLTPEQRRRQEHIEAKTNALMGTTKLEVPPLPVRPKSLPVEPKSLPVEPKFLPVKQKSLPVKQKFLPVKQKSLPVKQKSLPVKLEPLSFELKPLPVRPKSLPFEPKPLPVKPKPLPFEPKSKPKSPRRELDQYDQPDLRVIQKEQRLADERERAKGPMEFPEVQPHEKTEFERITVETRVTKEIMAAYNVQLSDPTIPLSEVPKVPLLESWDESVIRKRTKWVLSLKPDQYFEERPPYQLWVPRQDMVSYKIY